MSTSRLKTLGRPKIDYSRLHSEGTSDFEVFEEGESHPRKKKPRKMPGAKNSPSVSPSKPRTPKQRAPATQRTPAAQRAEGGAEGGVPITTPGNPPTKGTRSKKRLDLEDDWMNKSPEELEQIRLEEERKLEEATQKAEREDKMNQILELRARRLQALKESKKAKKLRVTLQKQSESSDSPVDSPPRRVVEKSERRKKRELSPEKPDRRKKREASSQGGSQAKRHRLSKAEERDSRSNKRRVFVDHDLDMEEALKAQEEAKERTYGP